MAKFNITIEFKTQAPITERTIQVAEAFGLGIDEEKIFTIYKDFEIEMNKGDIVYITGDSGSGKSQLLKGIVEKLHNHEDQIGSLNDIAIDPDEVLIENVGKTISEAIKYLSLVGLNDAYLFLRRYKELSDGQKYRYRLAKLINQDKKLWCADEWCSTLDREMAKIISYNFQKLARKLGKTAIVATCHTDLAEDLNPNLIVNKKFEDEVEIKRFTPEKRPCSVIKDLEIKEVSVKDIYSLMKFHYKNTKVSFTKKIYGLYKGTNLVGCIVYGCPPLALKGRSIAFGDRYKKENGRCDAQKINAEIAIISRVVVHPKYRSIGLGQYIVKATLDLSGFAVVETLATMAKYNPFFERANMTLVKQQDEAKKDKIFTNIKNCLEELGFDLAMIASKKYNKNILEKLSSEQIEHLRKVLTKNISYKNRRDFLNENKKVDMSHLTIEDFANYIPKSICQSMYYLYWKKNIKKHKEFEDIAKKLHSYGFDSTMLPSTKYVTEHLKTLTVDDIEDIKNMMYSKRKLLAGMYTEKLKGFENMNTEKLIKFITMSNFKEMNYLYWEKTNAKV